MKLAAGVAHTADVDGMLDTIGWEQFLEWQAFDRICPIDQLHRDIITANVRAAGLRYLATLAGEDQEFREAITGKLFCPWMDEPDEPPTSDEAIAAAQQANIESAAMRSKAAQEYDE